MLQSGGSPEAPASVKGFQAGRGHLEPWGRGLDLRQNPEVEERVRKKVKAILP